MSAMYVSSLFDYCRVVVRQGKFIVLFLGYIYIFNRQGMYMDQSKV